MPVYNAEKYLERSLNSLVKQTIFEKLQIIIVDDGSEDNSLNIANCFKAKYSNLFVIPVLHGGVSNARNLGLEKASGEYISFVDADDWVDQDCYERLYDMAIQAGTDIVIVGYYISTDKGDTHRISITDVASKKSQREIVKELLGEKIDGSCYDKLFKKNILENISFNKEITLAEDRLYVFVAVLAARSFFVSPEVFYHYYQNSNSLMHTKRVAANDDGIKVCKIILDRVKIDFEDFSSLAEAMYINMACRTYGELENSAWKDNQLYNSLKRDIKDYSILDGARYMSLKHFIALILAKLAPGLYHKIRSINFFRFVKI